MESAPWHMPSYLSTLAESTLLERTTSETVQMKTASDYFSSQEPFSRLLDGQHTLYYASDELSRLIRLQRSSRYRATVFPVLGDSPIVLVEFRSMTIL